MQAFTGNPMITGLNTGLFDNPIDQMKFDGIIQTADISTAVENKSSNDDIVNTPLTQEYTTNLLNNTRMTITPEANKPTVLVTPIHQPKALIVSTPIFDSNQFTLPGFTSSDIETWQETFPDHSDIARMMDILEKAKEYPDTVEKINDRYPVNADLAGKPYPLDRLGDLAQKYPDSVMFDEKGFARFEPYIYTDEEGINYKVESQSLTGNRQQDRNLANQVIGKILPEGYTWHHVEDGKTLIGIPKDLHDKIKHTGGAAKLKHSK